MHVAEIWRYPVKSLAGEQLQEAQLTENGVEGDRVVHVQGAHGLITSRTKYRLLGLHGRLGDDGQPLINGQPWSAPESRELVRQAAGPDAALYEHRGPERFDILPLLVATDGALAAFGWDHRRLRPNLVIGGVEGLAERHWPGGQLRIGEVLIHLDSLRARCVMTTFDPDTQEQDVEVLRDIRRRFGGELALNAAVLEPGRIRVGDLVQLIA
jgi:uncharacterized protein YcbX